MHKKIEAKKAEWDEKYKIYEEEQEQSLDDDDAEGGEGKGGDYGGDGGDGIDGGDGEEGDIWTRVPGMIEFFDEEEDANTTVTSIADQMQQIHSKMQTRIFTKEVKDDEKEILKMFTDMLYDRNRANINNIIKELNKYREAIKGMKEKDNEESDSDGEIH